MGQYTLSQIKAAETLSFDDDDFEEKLREIAKQFRGFDEALTEFITEHGYTGDASDVNVKAQFLREKFKAKGIKLPRDFKEWFVSVKNLDKDTLFQVCFAFGLNVDETEDFFRRIYCARGFDCHTIKEAVYYFCIKNHRTYADAKEIIERIPNSPKAKKLPVPGEIRYTGTIIQDIDSLADEEELIQYITSNIDSFRYNNATVSKYIQDLWHGISCPGGLAEREVPILERWNYCEEELDNRAVVDADISTWAVFSQILGLSKGTEKEYAVKYDRSLHSVFSNNNLMPLKAAYCFPNRQNIDKICRGELVGDDEVMRKLLILLVFYTYWAKISIDSGGKGLDDRQDDEAALKKSPDSDRCLYVINSRLLDAGYPILYAGNPYDWIFMWSLNNYNPLEAFRTYIGEVFTELPSQNQA